MRRLAGRPSSAIFGSCGAALNPECELHSTVNRTRACGSSTITRQQVLPGGQGGERYMRISPQLRMILMPTRASHWVRSTSRTRPAQLSPPIYRRSGSLVPSVLFVGAVRRRRLRGEVVEVIVVRWWGKVRVMVAHTTFTSLMRGGAGAGRRMTSKNRDCASGFQLSLIKFPARNKNSKYSIAQAPIWPPLAFAHASVHGARSPCVKGA